MTDQPTPTHQWTWTGSRDLPTWLTGHHHWHDDQLVIHTPDRYVHPEPGWLIVHWTDGTHTVASPHVAARVYGDDGLLGRLARAEAALAGEEPADTSRPTRRVHVTITNPDAYTANRAALSLVDWLAAEFPAHHVTTDAREWEQPDA